MTPEDYEPGTTVVGERVHYVQFDADDPRTDREAGTDFTRCGKVTYCEPTTADVDCLKCLGASNEECRT